jgi:hypothetical protein
MHKQIRRMEHRAEQLAVRFEELADQPDTTRIALAGIFTAVALCWFAVAWGEGLLLLALPLVVAACMVVVKIRRPEHDPTIADEGRDLGPEGAEIDAWLTRLTNRPLLSEREESRAAFAAPAPSFEAPLLPPPSPKQPPQAQPLEVASAHHEEALLEETRDEPELRDAPMITAIYEVSEIRAGARVLLEVRATFDAAVDAAFELIQERDPPELEIVLVRGDERETAWSYDREAAVGQPSGSLELFGFDATRWAARR